jgi:hypothetical protein
MTEHQETPAASKRPRLTNAQYIEARAMAAAGATIKQISAKFGIQYHSASRIVRTATVYEGIPAGAPRRSDDEKLRWLTDRAAKEIATIRAAAKAKITAIEASRDTKIAVITAQASARRQAAELEQSVQDEVAALTAAYEAQVRQVKETAKARLSGARADPATPPIPAAVVTPPTADTAARQAEWDAVKKAPKSSKASKKAIPELDAVPATAWSLVHDHQLPLRDVANRMGLSKSEVLAALAARKPHIEDRQLARISAMKFSDPD